MKRYSWYADTNFVYNDDGKYEEVVVYKDSDGTVRTRIVFHDHYRPNRKGGHRHNHIDNRLRYWSPSKRCRQATRRALRALRTEEEEND